MNNLFNSIDSIPFEVAFAYIAAIFVIITLFKKDKK